MDRSSLTSALISAHPLVTSDVGSSDRRTNDLGATFLFCISIIPYSPLDLKNYPLVPMKVYILFIPGGLISRLGLDCREPVFSNSLALEQCVLGP